MTSIIESKPKSKWFSSEEYRAKQSAYYSEIITCECGCQISRSHKTRHMNNSKHQQLLRIKEQLLNSLIQKLRT